MPASGLTPAMSRAVGVGLNELLAGKPAEETNMKKSDAISLHAKAGNWQRFPVMVWEEGKYLVTQVDGTVYKASNMFKLDSELDAGGVPSPRNLYYVDEPDYEDHDLPANTRYPTDQ